MNRKTVLFLLSLALILLPFTINADCMVVEFGVKGRVAYEGAPVPPAGASIELQVKDHHWTAAQPASGGEFVTSTLFNTHSANCFGRDYCNRTASALRLRVSAPGFETEYVNIPLEKSEQDGTVRSLGTITVRRKPTG